MRIQLPVWPPVWPEIAAAAADCVADGSWGRYDSVACRNLRDRLMAVFDAPVVRLCCSGSAAVELSLRASGVGPGDEVITAAFDYPGNVRAIEMLGARPVLVDVGPRSLDSGSLVLDTPCMDVDQIEEAASPQTKAVIASHLYGVAADVVGIRKLCDNHGWSLVEDACQVPGMRIDGRPAGSIGHFGTVSLGGSKLVTCGSGGAILASELTSSARLAPIIDRPSDALALSPLAAAVTMPQWDRLDELNRLRSRTAVFIRDSVMPEMTGWRWLSGTANQSAFYKVAFTVGSPAQRSRVVQRAMEVGLPIGPGFRSLAKTSQRRCRKPVPLDRSARLGDTALVLDHRALMIGSEQQDELAAAMRSLL